MASSTLSSPDSATFCEQFEYINSVVARVRAAFDSQLRTKPPVALESISAIFDHLERREGQEDMLPAPPPPSPASDVPNRVLILSAERGSSTLSQDGERPGPFIDDTDEDEAGTALAAKEVRDEALVDEDDAAAGSSVARDDVAPGPAMHKMVEEAGSRHGERPEEGGTAPASQDKKRETRVPTKYASANRANLLQDEYGLRIPEWEGNEVRFTKRRPWMTPEEEQAFFNNCSFERCFKCSELGHMLDNCDTGLAKCMYCEEDHTSESCRAKRPKCGFCGGRHVRGGAACVHGEIDRLKENYLVMYYSGQL